MEGRNTPRSFLSASHTLLITERLIVILFRILLLPLLPMPHPLIPRALPLPNHVTYHKDKKQFLITEPSHVFQRLRMPWSPQIHPNT